MIIRTISIVDDKKITVSVDKEHEFYNTLAALRYVKNLRKKNKGCTIVLDKPLATKKEIATMRAEWEKYEKGGGTKQEFIDEYMGECTEGATFDNYMCDFIENEYSMGKAYKSKATNLFYLQKALSFNEEEMVAELWLWKNEGSLTTFENYLEVKYNTRDETLVALNRNGARIKKSKVKGKLNEKILTKDGSLTLWAFENYLEVKNNLNLNEGN